MATYAHELSHNLSIPDNYNNPFGTTQQRAATGIWDMMSRGSFNGPGGTHTRYLIPPTLGGSLGAQHNVRNKRKLNFISDNEIVRLNRDGLAQSGVAVAEVTAREVAPGAGRGRRADHARRRRRHGDAVRPEHQPAVRRRPPRGQRHRSPASTTTTRSRPSSGSAPTRSRPAQGVLISKTKNDGASCGTFTCFVWVIDANPQDINRLDFVKPDGTPQMVTIADPRQLNDAPFNAGTNSGTEYEYVDNDNRLHFYVLDVRKDADGRRALQGRGALAGRRRAADARREARSTPVPGTDAGLGHLHVRLTNTGAAAATPNAHPQDVVAFLGATSTACARPRTARAGRRSCERARHGEVRRDGPGPGVRHARAPAPGSVTLQATSESDPSKCMAASCSERRRRRLGPGDALADHWHPGDLRAVHARRRARLHGDDGAPTWSPPPATRRCRSPIRPPTAPGRLVNGAFSLAAPLQAKAVERRGDGRRLRARCPASCWPTPARRPTTRSRSGSDSASAPTSRCVPGRTARR